MSPETDRPHVYTPLASDRSIRVIELEPSSHLTDKIRCKLVEVDLDGTDPYYAISYTWGPPYFSHELSIVGSDGDGKETERVVRITESLSDALRTFRYADRPRRIWADAVCINQNDEDEKSKQIPLMSTIYGRAYQVLVWLGNEGSGSAAMDYLHQLWTRMPQHGLTEIEEKEEAKRNLSTLTKLSWFTRRWVIQEVVMNSDVTLHCGASTMSWQRFAMLARRLPSGHDHDHDHGNTYARQQAVVKMYELWQSLALSLKIGQESVLRLLERFADHGCADGRDRLFSLMGMADDVDIVTGDDDGSEGMLTPLDENEDRWWTGRNRYSQDADDKVPIRIRPLYSREVHQVYTDTAKSMMMAGHMPWLLTQAACRLDGDPDPNIPSWVPDWRKPIYRLPLWGDMYHIPMVFISRIASTPPRHVICTEQANEKAPHFGKTGISVSWLSEPFPASSRPLGGVDEEEAITQTIAWVRDVLYTIPRRRSEGSDGRDLEVLAVIAYCVFANGSTFARRMEEQGIQSKARELGIKIRDEVKDFEELISPQARRVFNGFGDIFTATPETWALVHLLERLLPETRLMVEGEIHNDAQDGTLLREVRYLMHNRVFFLCESTQDLLKQTFSPFGNAHPFKLYGIGPSSTAKGDMVLAPCPFSSSTADDDILGSSSGSGQDHWKWTYLVRPEKQGTLKPPDLADLALPLPEGNRDRVSEARELRLVGECFLGERGWRVRAQLRERRQEADGFSRCCLSHANGPRVASSSGLGSLRRGYRYRFVLA